MGAVWLRGASWRKVFGLESGVFGLKVSLGESWMGICGLEVRLGGIEVRLGGMCLACKAACLA